MRKMITWAAVLLGVALGNARAQTTQYDRFFRDYTAYHFGGQVSPTWIKATAMAESGLKYNARSGVGAQGLMQFMPATWADVAPAPWKEMGALDPEAAIFVGARYMRQLWGRLPKPEIAQRKALVNASYNSGLGNVFKAQKACALVTACVPTIWDSPNVETHLVTKLQFQAETKGYVRRIRQFEARLGVWR